MICTKAIVRLCSFLLLAPICEAAEGDAVLLSIAPARMPANVELLSGAWEKENDRDVLRVPVADAQGEQPVLEIKNPPIAQSNYTLRGEVRSESMAGEGYLELINFFPNGKSYFSRTLSGSGAQGKLRGSFGWRHFALPFERTAALPVKLQLNIKAPPGSVLYLSDLALDESADPSTAAWLTPTQLGIGGGILGAIVGFVGALIGVFSARGRARSLVLLIVDILLTASAALFATGVVAVVVAQPQFLSTSFLLGGGFLLLLFSGVRRTLVRSYEALRTRSDVSSP